MAKIIKCQEHPLLKQAKERFFEAIRESEFLCKVYHNLFLQLIDPPTDPDARHHLEEAVNEARMEFEDYQTKIYHAAEMLRMAEHNHGISPFGSTFDLED